MKKVIPYFVFLGFLGVYIITRTHLFSYDAITYALSLDYASGLILFHPYHLLALVPAHLGTQFLAFCGITIPSLYVLQAINGVVGALGLSVLYGAFLNRVSWKTALAAVAVCGFSYVYWYESTDGGSYAWAGMMLALLLLETLRCAPLRVDRIGVIWGFSIAVHGMFVVIAPALYFRLVGQSGRRSAFRLISVGMMVAGLCYALVLGVFYRGPFDGILPWIFGPPAPSPTMGVFSNPMWVVDFPGNTLASWQGWVTSWAALKKIGIQRFFSMALLLACGVLAVRLWRKRTDPIVVFCVIWIGALSAVQFFYAPGIERFRLLFLAVFVVLVVEAGLSFQWLTFVALGLLVINFQQNIYPHMREESNPHIVRAKWVASQLTENDFFLFAGRGSQSIINVYMAYFSPRVKARSLQGYFYAHPSASGASLRAAMESQRGPQGRIFMEEAVFSPEIQAAIEVGGRLEKGALSRWLNSFQKKNAIEYDEYRIYEMIGEHGT